MVTVIQLKTKKQKDFEILEFVKQLPTIKNLKVYRLGEAENLSPEEQTPAMRRLLIRERNASV